MDRRTDFETREYFGRSHDWRYHNRRKICAEFSLERLSRDRYLRFLRCPLTKLAQILKTVNTCLVRVAPAKIQRISSDGCDIANRDFVRNTPWFQSPFAGPFIHTLGAGTSASQLGGFILAHAAVTPGNAQFGVALLQDLARHDRLAFFSTRNFHSL